MGENVVKEDKASVSNSLECTEMMQKLNGAISAIRYNSKKGAYALNEVLEGTGANLNLGEILRNEALGEWKRSERERIEAIRNYYGACERLGSARFAWFFSGAEPCRRRKKMNDAFSSALIVSLVILKYSYCVCGDEDSLELGKKLANSALASDPYISLNRRAAKLSQFFHS